MSLRAASLNGGDLDLTRRFLPAALLWLTPHTRTSNITVEVWLTLGRSLCIRLSLAYLPRLVLLTGNSL